MWLFSFYEKLNCVVSKVLKVCTDSKKRLPLYYMYKQTSMYISSEQFCMPKPDTYEFPSATENSGIQASPDS